MRHSIRLFSFLIGMSLGCSNDKVVPDKEAIQLIRAAGGYPRPVTATFSGVRPSSPLGKELLRLRDQGYMVDKHEWPGGVYGPTETGKAIFASAHWNGYYGYWEAFDAYTHEEDVAQITDKRRDPTTGAVTVLYEVRRTGTPYLSHLASLSRSEVSTAVSRVSASTEYAAVFERWEKGWRLVSNERLRAASASAPMPSEESTGKHDASVGEAAGGTAASDTAALRHDLINLLTAEEAFFADSSHYTTDITKLKRFKPSSGAAAPAIGLSCTSVNQPSSGAKSILDNIPSAANAKPQAVPSCWSAVLAQADGKKKCAIGVNTVNPLASDAKDGDIVCK